MKIALINPKFENSKSHLYKTYSTPLGIGYISSYLKSKNISSDIFDFANCFASDFSVITKYRLYKYDIIGFSTYTISFKNLINFIILLKKFSPNIIIILGGHHVSPMPIKILEDFKNIDFIIEGYGELPFYNLITKLKNNDNDFRLVNGLTYRKESRILRNIPVNPNIDIFPFPRRINLGKSNTLNIISSRGCPYNCSYCINSREKKWVFRDINNILEEIENAYNLQPFDSILFMDCNFFVDSSRALTLLRKIKQKYKTITFSFSLRADQITTHRDLFYELKKLGCSSVSVGIENNNTNVLKRFNKVTTPKINQDAIDILRELKITPHVFFIMFDPFSTFEEIRDTFSFIQKNNLYLDSENLYNTLIPYVGTEYFEKYNQYFYIVLHGISVPKYQNKDVSIFKNELSKFRNLYDDKLSYLKFELSKLYKTGLYKDYDCGILLNILAQFPFIFFDYLLSEYENKNFLSCDSLLQSKKICLYVEIIENFELYVNSRIGGKNESFVGTSTF